MGRAGISVFPKEHQNLITEAHYILATISLKFRARITKFQGDVPEALKHDISLVRLIVCTDHVNLAAAQRISMQDSARIANLTRKSNCGAAQSDFLLREEGEIVCRFEGKLRMRVMLVIDVGY